MALEHDFWRETCCRFHDLAWIFAANPAGARPAAAVHTLDFPIRTPVGRTKPHASTLRAFEELRRIG